MEKKENNNKPKTKAKIKLKKKVVKKNPETKYTSEKPRK